MKLAMNYSLSDRGDLLNELEPVSGAGAIASGFKRGLQTQIGGRYVYAWSRDQQYLGKGGQPLPVNASRLTWQDVGTGGVELYGRIDTPWNVMLKGIVGVGRGGGGRSTTGIRGLFSGYRGAQITKSNVSSSLNDFTLDGGYDWLRTDTYRVASFVGLTT